jgi:hypothetical protein
MTPILYQCPRTQLTVQTLLPITGHHDKSNVYETVTCPACSQLHFIERASGRLLGEERK